MAKPKKDPLTTHALPSLALASGFWECTVILPSWSGFQSRRRPYGSRDSTKKSDGSTQLAIAPPDNGETPPSPEQIAAYTYSVEHQETIRDQILSAILEKIPQIRARFLEFASPTETFPVVDTADDLRNVMGITSFLIHPVSLEGIAYVGYEFGCAWDIEHGLGVMMHRDRVVEVGGADTAILEWIAQKDSKRARKKRK